MTGLVIGKFCPPHKGHRMLIDTALAETDRLIVLVCSSQDDPIAAETRLEWLREIHPTVDFHLLFPDAFDRSDAQAWVRATLQEIGQPPDMVFSSEDYGVLYARLLGCGHRMVDKERVKVPCQASDILRDPTAYLRYLEPIVSDYFIQHHPPQNE